MPNNKYQAEYAFGATMAKQIPEDIRKLSRERAPRFHTLMKQKSQPHLIEVGQIWSTHSVLNLPGFPEARTDEPRLVVILTGSGAVSSLYEQITVAPISLGTWGATDFDLLVGENESSLPYRFMVEVWNETPALKAHLRANLGGLSSKCIAFMRGIHLARLVDEPLPDEIRDSVGLPLMSENDARVVFQEAEVEAVEYMANTATSVVFADLAALNNSESEKKDAVTSRMRFEVKAILDDIERYLLNPKKAFAASNAASKVPILGQLDGEFNFVFQVSYNRKESKLYLVVQRLSRNLEGKSCVVTLTLEHAQLHSERVVLRTGEYIQMGQLPNFEKSQVLGATLEVESQDE